MHKLILALTLFSSAAAHACEAPESLRTSRNSRVAYVMKPGTYCLDWEVKQYALFDMHAFSRKSQAWEPLFHVNDERHSTAPGDYVIDLGGHTLWAEALDMLGVSSKAPGKNVHVSNGTIIVPGKRYATGVRLATARPDGFAVAGEKYGVYPGAEKYEDLPFTELLERRKPRYRDEHHIVEKLDIQSGYRGIVIGGVNNVIRNNRIEVDGHTAIYAYGPGTVIENNTIIVRGKLDRKEWDAAIKLRDADGAIIRNNEIIFEGMLFAKGDTAVNLLDSDNVTVEGNTIKGYRQSVRTRGETTFVENGTVPSR